MNNKITYRREGDYLIPNLYIKDYKKCDYNIGKYGRLRLNYLKEHKITAAIATATDMQRTEKYLQLTGLRPYFDTLISATMVKEGKPSPDIYAYACEQLGLAPGECIAVEDSPNGVLSAYRAGCQVVMVPDQTEPDEELQKLLYARVDTLEGIISLLEG